MRLMRVPNAAPRAAQTAAFAQGAEIVSTFSAFVGGPMRSMGNGTELSGQGGPLAKFNAFTHDIQAFVTKAVGKGQAGAAGRCVRQ